MSGEEGKGHGFLSTSSARRTTIIMLLGAMSTPDFYPRSPRGGRPIVRSCASFLPYFYPRPPRGGRR